MTAAQSEFPGKDIIRLAETPDFGIGWLKIRPSLREMRWPDGYEILEPRVMQVLVALVRAGGAVVSRDDLIRQCWEGRIVGEAAISRCIWKLRELARTGDQPAFAIETIPRVGYRLIAAETDQASEASLPNITHDTSSSLAGPATDYTQQHDQSWVWVGVIGVALIGLVIAAILYFRHLPSGVPASSAVTAQSAQKPSIAVLPFRNLSTGQDTSYFAEGVQDEILTRLAKVGSLKVISRTSTDQYAGRPRNLKQIAKELGVANILEGSVQREGGKVRVNVQLIRAKTDDHLWAEDYDRDMNHVLAVESEVARDIAYTLAARITGSEESVLAAKLTSNPKAYDLYLRALALIHRQGSRSENDVAEKYLEQAVRDDPNFAAAWALLSRQEALNAFDGASGKIEPARNALHKAQAIAPQLPETRMAAGFFRYYAQRDYGGALREFTALKKIWPNNVEILRALAFLSRRLGKWENARIYLTEAIALDPHSLESYKFLASLLDDMDQLPEALQLLDKALLIWPSNRSLSLYKAVILMDANQMDLANAILARFPLKLPDDANDISIYAAPYLYGRHYGEGVRYLKGIFSTAGSATTKETMAHLLTNIAVLEMHAGQTEHARQDFTAARDIWLRFLHQNPLDTAIMRPLAYCEASLGDSASAIKVAEQAMADYPLSDDTIEAVNAILIRVSVAARIGDKKTAIALLKKIAGLPASPSARSLRLDPDYDSLRGDPEFEKLAHADGQ